MPDPAPIRGRWTIWECPECGFYDADPILRRGPGTRHGPMRCFACGKRAVEALDLARIATSHHEHYKHKARESAPLMVARRGGPVPDEAAIERGAKALHRRDVNDPAWRDVNDPAWREWDHLTVALQDEYRADARAVLGGALEPQDDQ